MEYALYSNMVLSKRQLVFEGELLTDSFLTNRRWPRHPDVIVIPRMTLVFFLDSSSEAGMTITF